MLEALDPIEAEHHIRLAGLGYCVKNTFVEEEAPPGSEPCNRRARSDPTSNSSSRSSSEESQKRYDDLKKLRPQLTLQQDQQQDQKEDPLMDDEQTLRKRAKELDLDFDEVMANLPLNVDGSLTSLGSMQHFAGNCKPCAFSTVHGQPLQPVECVSGIFCRFCHFQHFIKPKFRIRPCKTRRDRVKKLTSRLADEYGNQPMGAPGAPIVDEDALPDWIQRKPLLKDMVVNGVTHRVAEAQASAKQEMEQGMQVNEVARASMKDPWAGFASSSLASSSSATAPFSAVASESHIVPRTDGGSSARVFRMSL